jgi:hypothetical protein
LPFLRSCEQHKNDTIAGTSGLREF